MGLMREPIELDANDGMEIVRVRTADGSAVEKMVDIYALGKKCLRLYRDIKAANETEGYEAKLVELFAANGLAGLSEKAADTLAAELIRRMEAEVKKSTPTPAPE